MAKKKRTINELRQVKDAVYQPPISHQDAKIENTKERVIEYLIKSHSILFENYPPSALNQYVLSSLSHLVGLLKEPNEED